MDTYLQFRFASKMLILCGMFCVLYSVQASFIPTCEKDNQFRFSCFPIQSCSRRSFSECTFDQCGFHDDNEILRIGETSIIPTCAMINMPSVNYILAVQSKIEVIAAGAFMNLPNVTIINLSFNLLRELRPGIFHNVSVSSLDFSWNKLEYIEKGAFDGIRNLKHLNLSRNDLQTVPINQLSPTLEHLILSHNLLNRILLNSQRFANLTSIDLSFNNIDHIALSFDYAITKLDLTHNRLQKFDYIDIWSIDELKIALNNFMKVPEHLLYLNAKKIDLYPNPWKCDELQKVWSQLNRNDISIIKDASSKDKPICVVPSNKTMKNASNPEEEYKILGALTLFKVSQIKCYSDQDCAENMICRSGKCWDPCKEKVCDDTSKCRVVDHHFSCDCLEGSRRDILDVFSVCHQVECFLSSDCKDNKYCDNNECIKSKYGGGYGHGGHGHGGHGHGGHGSYGGHGGYGGYSGHGSYGGNVGFNKTPWWFEEIPRLVSPPINRTLTSPVPNT